MTQAREHELLLSIVGPDRVGLISAITARLFDLGINLADTSFSVLGAGCEFTGVALAPVELDAETVERELAGLPALAEAEVRVSRFGFGAEGGGQANYRIEVEGGDRPGLVARLTEAFIEFDANVVRMTCTRVPLRGGEAAYVTSFAVAIPPARAQACLAAVRNTAGQLQLECAFREI